MGKNNLPVETSEELSAATRVLAKSIAKWTGNENQLDTAIPVLGLHRWESPTEPTSYTLNASICLIAQGAKRVSLKGSSYSMLTCGKIEKSIGLGALDLAAASPKTSVNKLLQSQ